VEGSGGDAQVLHFAGLKRELRRIARGVERAACGGDDWSRRGCIAEDEPWWSPLQSVAPKAAISEDGGFAVERERLEAIREILARRLDCGR